MQNDRAIPEGYMTVGKLAKRMNTTVRTLQYYDREGLLSPSAESEGGRRLYTEKDMVLLHQIQSMKYLGFSLDDIKNRLTSLETPGEVAEALSGQAGRIREKIASLTEALEAIEALKSEILQIKSVDFKKYAEIIALLQVKNEHYWVIKYFDDRLMEHIKNRFDGKSGMAMIDTWRGLCARTAELAKNGVDPESPEAQEMAKKWWDMVLEFTGGDMSLLPQLMQFGESGESLSDEWQKNQAAANDFIGKALTAYFTNLGYNPFEGAEK